MLRNQSISKGQQLWLANGDRSTKYFDVVINRRKVENRIHALKRSVSEWCFNQKDLKSMANDYLLDQFTTFHSHSLMLDFKALGVPKLK